MPLQDVIAGPVKEPLYVLLAAVGFVLLIACANVANLLLARGISRSREMAVRAALGAGRGRLIRQLVTESLLLWTAGGIAGMAVGAYLLQTLADLAPVELPRAAAIGIDRWVLGFSAVLSVGTGLLFGLLPALNTTPLRLTSALATDARGSVGGSSRRARQALVVVDLAVALVLLVGAGLMLKSVARLVSVDPGFNSERVLTAQFSLIGEAYREDPAVYGFIERVVTRVRALPGVEAAAAAGQVPMGGNGDRFGFHIEGMQPANPAEAPSPERYSVTPDYFRVMQIPLRARPTVHGGGHHHGGAGDRDLGNGSPDAVSGRGSNRPSGARRRTDRYAVANHCRCRRRRQAHGSCRRRSGRRCTCRSPK